MTSLYFRQCTLAWTGDGWGKEWKLGWSVYANDIKDDDQKPFVIYENDGRGNGDYVRDCDTLAEAIAFIDRFVTEADSIGFSVDNGCE